MGIFQSSSAKLVSVYPVFILMRMDPDSHGSGFAQIWIRTDPDSSGSALFWKAGSGAAVEAQNRALECLNAHNGGLEAQNGAADGL
jgi:hypothetical protein